jgi:predicted TIM-barrel fold metal-dependent hydrolase
MIGDKIVVDAVVHPYDLAPANQITSAQGQLEAVYAAHRMASDTRHQHFVLEHDEFFSDFSFEALAQAEFVESPVDLAVIHALPGLGFAKTHVTAPQRAAAFRNRYPNRFKVYATIDTPVLKEAIAQLEHQVKDLGVDGLKLYPAFFYDGIGQGWRLDGEAFATPLLEAAIDMGIKHVAIHKALWLPPAPREAFNVDDVGMPLDRFPTLTFEIVHGGTAFLDETRALLERHSNLYLTLETMFAYIQVKPRIFAKILGSFIKDCGSERLMFASGNNLMHPRPIVEAFAGYQFPDEWADEFGLTPLTEQDRRNILGLNCLRMHGLDAVEVARRVAHDEFSQARAQGIPAPWSALRGTALSPSA